MAEVLGVASGVAGIVSVGIQVAQGLLKYYGSWKDQDQDILNMCLSLESLLRTLVIVSDTITPSAKFARSVTENVEKNLQPIKQAVNKLGDKLEKFIDLGISKQDVAGYSESISEARSNLDLALHALQVSGISDVRHDVNRIVHWHEDNETQQILNWLSPENFRRKQRDVSSQRQPGTGQWLLDHPDFLAWAEGNTESIWCLGSPGVGKTVLSSALVEFLEIDLPVEKIGLAFIYCDHKRNKSQRLEYFISAIARQLAERKQTIPLCLRTLYTEHRRKGSIPTLNEYLGLLKSLSIECIDKDAKMVWNNLRISLKKNIANLRRLCTSRHINDVAKTSLGSTCIKIQAIDKDVRTYIQAQIETQTGLSIFCQQDPNLENDILQTVVSKAEGMFLAAQLHIKSLASKTNLRAIKRALNAMPANIDDIYDQTMEKIKRHPHESLARQALYWIVYATRPLRVQEVQHAIAIDDFEPDDEFIAEESLTPKAFLVDVCAGLIKIDEKSDIIDAKLSIGTRCLKYLCLDVFCEGISPTDELYESRTRQNALLGYAAQNLENHIPKETGPELQDLALKFLMNTRKVSCASQVLFTGLIEWGWVGYSDVYPRDFLGIHYAAYLGLTEIFTCLIQNAETRVEARDRDGSTALSYAARRGHEAVVELLLEANADIESKDKYGVTPLLYAAGEGYEAVVKLLLKAKANVNNKNDYGLSPLLYAAGRGHKAVVKLLLKAKADVECIKYGLTPLLYAARGRHEAVLKLLLEAKANVEFKSKNGWTPLLYAAVGGHEAVVKLLLEIKADVEAKNNDGWTPLLYAAREGQEAVMKLLLEVKADVESKNRNGWTPLLYAAKQGHKTVVRQLLDARADIDFRNKDGRTPLSYAAEEGYEAIIKLLLEAGANIESKDVNDRTPLSYAAEQGYEAVVTLLQSTTTITSHF